MAYLFLGIAKDITAHGLPIKRPACVIAGGETTVTLRGHGKGGRNQEMALAYLAAYARSPKDAGSAVFLAASTDGSDGPTDATGAFASPAILDEGRRKGLEPTHFLAENDAYHYFEHLGRLLKTGPTNTNVCDIKVLPPGPLGHRAANAVRAQEPCFCAFLRPETSQPGIDAYNSDQENSRWVPRRPGSVAL